MTIHLELMEKNIYTVLSLVFYLNIPYLYTEKPFFYRAHTISLLYSQTTQKLAAHLLLIEKQKEK